MKKTRLLLALTLLFAACSTSNTDRLYLTDWQYSNTECDFWKATVPGFIHTDLLSKRRIPDPYFGTNEDSVRSISDLPWTYSTNITPEFLPEGDTLWLVFEGLAGNAEIMAYDGDMHTLGYADNMFVSHSFPLTDIDVKNIYEIRVRFYPLNDSLRQTEYGIPLPDRRAFTRIAPYQQGWDWGPKLPTCGIWKPVYITNKRAESGKWEAENGKRGKIELRQEKDSIGQSFTFYKDGKPIFIKGANWIPVHSFPVDDNANRARYRYLLCSAKEANFNMIRVWGGGIYEHDYFFDLCDSLGLMVWMDFNFSCALYPDSPDFLESIAKEARQNIARIARHPCVVLWCGNNEVKNGWEDWGWQDVYHWTPEQRTRLQHAIDTIFGNAGILAQAVRECDPLQRPYITTSPLFGWGHPECTTDGDSHYWGVWWGEEPFEAYKDKTGRFMSEYGFQSYPLIASVRQFCTADELNISSPTLRSHQKHARGREIIDKAMQQYYGFDSRTLSLADYAYVSQLLQAWGVGYGILCHISNPRCAGTLYWQLNDSWPVASWSSIDYYGNWKALHYRAQALFGAESGKRRAESGERSIDEWQQYYATYPKNRRYDKAQYTLNQRIEGGRLVVTITAQSDLYDVCLEPQPFRNGHFDRNFFDLKKGERVTARFIPAPEAMSHTMGYGTLPQNGTSTPQSVAVRTLNDLYSK